MAANVSEFEFRPQVANLLQGDSEEGPEGTELRAQTVEIEEEEKREFEVQRQTIIVSGQEASLIVAHDVSAHRQMMKSKEILFIASCSHELRTPLNSILGLLELAKEDSGVSPKTLSFLDVALTSGQHLLTLVSDILDLTKIASGKLQLLSKPFSLRRLVTQCLDLMSFQTSQRNIELVHDIDLDLPDQFKGDPNRLKQVLLNLLSNAAKFTLKGHISLRISLAEDPDLAPPEPISAFTSASASTPSAFPQRPSLQPLRVVRRSTSGVCVCVRSRLVSFEVEDTGMGIKEKNFKELFSVFGKLKDKHSLNEQGSGLGLLICRQLVECMGGSISVQSVYGQGSTFTFTVRLAESDRSCPVCFLNNCSPSPVCTPTPTAMSFEFVDTSSSGSMAVAPPKRVLLVDDTEFNVFVVQAYIGDKYQVEVARNGQQAVDMVRESFGGLASTGSSPGHKVSGTASSPATWTTSGAPSSSPSSNPPAAPEERSKHYDIILMDCEMPLLNGYEASTEIRKLEREFSVKPVPIVGLTALAMPGDREKCLAAGMDDYLTKPVAKQVLLSTMSRWLNRGRHMLLSQPSFPLMEEGTVHSAVSNFHCKRR